MPFPPGLQFTPLLLGSGFLYDSAGDQSPAGTDLVGTATQFPVAYIAYDETNVYFRMRVNRDPRNSAQTAFQNFNWGVLVNTNGVAGTYQYLIGVSGVRNRINIIQNTVQQVNSWTDTAEGTGGGTPNKTYPIVNFDVARVSSVTDGSNFSGNPDFFIDFFVPATDFFSLLGVNASSPLRFVVYTSTNDNNYNKDSLRTNEGFQFTNAFTNPITLDQANVKAKLEVTKVQTGGPTSVFTGQVNTYSGTITVTNSGKNQAINVFATDVFGLNSISSVTITSTSRGTAVYNASTGVISWTIGTIPANQTGILTFTATGIFTVSGTRPLDTVTVTGTDSFTGTTLPQQQATVNINVTASGGVAGQVTNSSNGQPISGALVQLRTTGGVLVSQTNSDVNGNYGFANIAPGTYNVVVSAATFVTGTVGTSIVSGQTTTTNVALAPVPGTINGTVTSTGGGAISGAVVRLIDTFGAVVATASTNASGAYSFASVTPGTYSVNVSASGFQSGSQSVILDNAETETVNFVLSPTPGTISGTVTSTTGAPIPGAFVEVLNVNDQVVATATASAGGTYTINSLAPGTYRVRFSATNFGTVIIGATVTAGATTTVNAQLPPNPGSLSGTVTDSQTGAVLVGASVRVVDSQGTTVATRVTNASGTYFVASLQPGSYTVIFGQDGYASQTIGAIITSGVTTTVNAALRREAGILNGTVTTVTGTAIPNANVQVFQNNTLIAATTTNSSGFYEINNLAPGVYIVDASAATFVTQQLGATINDLQTTVLNFQLEGSPGTLTGTVRSSGGALLPGTAITVTNNLGQIVANAVTDSFGSYTIGGLLAGNYVVTASLSSFQTGINGAIITQGGTTVSDFTLSPSPVSITGTITNAQTGTPISGANVQVRVLDINGVVIATASSNPSGVYLVDQLPPGTYTVVASAVDFQTSSGSVTVAAGQQGVVDLALEPNPGRIQGLIFDATNNQPIPGASVSVTDNNGFLVTTTVTDSFGNYTADGLPPGFYIVVAIAASYQNGFTGANVFAGATTAASIGLQPNPGSIGGTITPGISGTLVELYTNDNIFVASIVTDNTGNYRFDNLAVGNYNVIASAPNFSTERAGAFVQSDQLTTVNLTLTPNPATILGQVVDNTGTPIPNATVRVFDQSEVLLGSAQTDVNGNYSIGQLPQGNLTVIASATNFSNDFTGISPAPGEIITGVDFVLTPDPGSITGQVTNSTTGEALAGANVELRTENGLNIATTVTDPFGDYIFTGLAPGSYSVIASQPNFATGFVGANVLSNTSTAANIALVPTVGIISGQVTDTSGNPITGPSILVKLLDAQGNTLITILANTDGSFIFPDLAAGNYSINASAPDFAANTVGAIVNANQTTTVNVPLTPLPATVTGSVTNSLTGLPIAGATVTASGNNGIVLSTSVTDQNGDFIFTNLPAGVLEISATAPNFGSDSRQVATTPGGTFSTFLVLEPNPGSLEGFITDLFTGLPIEGANLTLLDNTFAVVATAVSDNRGFYTVNNLAPQRYTVRVEALNYGADAASADIFSDQVVVLSFALRSNPGTISGQVVDAVTNLPIQGATVRLRQFSPVGNVIAVQLTDAQGNYQFTTVSAETYAVQASADGYVTAAATVVITPGEQEVVNLFLDQQPASVRGTVTDAQTGSPLINAAVRLVDVNGVLLRAIQTDANGQYQINDIASGTYDITAILTSFQRQTFGFTVGPGETAIVNFALDPNAGFIAGTVTDSETGSPIVGATVDIYFANTTTLAARALTDSFGSYQTRGLVPGVYTVTSTATNYGTSTVGATVISDQTTFADLTLDPFPASVSGTIFTPEGVPLLNASVRVIDQNNIVIGSGVSAADGTYSIGNLPQGNFTVVATAIGFQSAQAGVILTPGLNVTGVDFTLLRNPGLITGVVTDAFTGATLGGANVSFFLDNNLIGSTVTDVNGNYNSPSLAPGSYVVQGSLNQYGTNSVGAVVVSDQTVQANIALSPITGSLTGSVIDTDGNPVTGPNTVIQILNQSGIVVQTVAADANGTFSLVNILPGTYTLNTSSPGFATATTSVTIVDNTTTNVIIVLQEIIANLSGIVADPAGNPIGNATVTVTDINQIVIRTVLTNNLGNFVLQDLPTGSFTVAATATGFGSASQAVTLEPFETEFVSLTLTANPGSITGIVSDPAGGVPIAGAAIRVTDATGALITTVLTDSNGQFLIQNLSPGNYQLNVSAEGFVSTVVGAIVTSDTVTTVNVSLSAVPPGAVQGIVTNALSGAPIAGASVQLRVLSPSGPIFATTITDAAGQFFVGNLQPDTQYTVIVSGTGFGTETQSFSAASDQTVSLAFALTPNPANVQGQVVSSTGAPLVNTLVRLTDTVTGAVLAETQTNALGLYSIQGFAPGTYDLAVRNDLFQSQVQEFTAAAGETVTLNFILQQNPGALTGQVTDLTGTPLTGAVVELFLGTVPVANTVTDSSGNYSFNGLAPGNYSASASAVNFTSATQPVTIVSNQTATQNFALSPEPSSISGTVSSSAGGPLAGASVRVLDLNGNTIANVTTGSDGSYTLTNLPAGTFDVRAESSGFPSSTIRLTLTINEDRTGVNFVLQAVPPSTVNGALLDETGTPVANGSIQVLDASGLTVGTAITDAFGNFTVLNLPAGTFSVRGSAAGFVDGFTGITLAQGQTLNNVVVVVTRIPVPGAITGNVINALGGPIAGAQIAVRNQSGTIVQTANTDASGFFNVTNLAPGSYSVTAQADGFGTGFTGALVTEGATTNVTITLLTALGNVNGQVVNAETGGPIPNTSIIISEVGTGLIVTEAATDANGLYSVQNLAPGDYLVTARNPAFQIAIEFLGLAAGETETINFALLPAPGAVTGTVINAETGELITGAVIDILSNLVVVASQATNVSAVYSIGGLAEGFVSIRATAPGFETATFLVQIIGGQIVVQNFALLATPGSISGFVTAADGSPVPGAAVQAFNEAGGLLGTAIVQENGAYTLNGLPAGNITLIAVAAGFANVSREVTLQRGQNLTNINLVFPDEDPASVSGTVTDVNGVPIPNALVQVFDSLNNLIGTALTDENGDYIVENLPAGSFRVVVSATGFQSQNTGIVLVPGQDLTDVNFALVSAGAPGILTGQVTSDTGAVIPGAEIILRDQNGFVVGVEVADSNGNFTFEALSAGTYSVTVTADGFGAFAAVVSIVSGETTLLNPVLESDPGFITGTITNADTGAPLPETLVRIVDANGNVIAELITDANGNFTSPGLAAGSYTVVVINPDFLGEVVSVTVVSGQTETVNIALEPNPGSLFGTVVNSETGEPIAGALVEIFLGQNLITTVFTDAFGEFEVSGLPEAILTVTATAPGFAIDTEDVAVFAGQQSTVSLALLPNPATVSGFVITDTGAPVANASVRAINEAGEIVQTATTDSLGRFTLTNLPPGTLTIIAFAEGFPSASVDVTLAQGEVLEGVTLVLSQEPVGTISGTITDVNGNPVPGAVINIFDENGNLVGTGITDENGNFSITNLPSGTLTIDVTALGFVSQERDVFLQPGQTLPGTDFVLVPVSGFGSVQGTITDNRGRPVAGALVEIRDANGVLVDTEVTNEAGNFFVDGLPAGTYTITVIAAGFQTATAAATVVADQTTTVNVTLSPVVPPIPPVPPTPGPAQPSNKLFLINQGTGQPLYLGGLTFPTEFVLVREDPASGCSIFSYQDVNASGDIITRNYVTDLSCFSVVFRA
ncbi:beta strand repeat-containing protein [Fictibacillus iocasae]|uniref:Beta strand repeat-containing protein n=1 Tax=Fictibacillus iocasae TaxID=2715437 RepID=A0ABW2NI91_9BACL